MFTLPDPIPDGIWMKNKDSLPTPPPNFQISIHSGPTDAMAAMATIEIADLKELVREILQLNSHFSGTCLQYVIVTLKYAVNLFYTGNNNDNSKG